MVGLYSRPMVSVHAKKHDNFSVEFKFSFEASDALKENDFAVNSWIFVPGSVGISPETYGKEQFYRDVKSNIRLITPKYSLAQLSDPEALPMASLRSSIENVAGNPRKEALEDYIYHLKMFAAIFKSAARDSEHRLKGSKASDKQKGIIGDYCRFCSLIARNYRSLEALVRGLGNEREQVLKYFRLVDEFISHIIEMRALRMLRKIDGLKNTQELKEQREALVALVEGEKKYKIRKHYLSLNEDQEHNRQVVYHHGMLKKFVESDLYINLDKKKDGVAVEQIYYSLAAGVAMIFATAVGWMTQLKFGNITWPLFIVLVISYMMKDRIKELMRFYFAHKLGNKYFDKKAKISIGKRNIGEVKEGFDFISYDKAPEKVLSMRNFAATINDAGRIFEEKIMLYRKRVCISSRELHEGNEYPLNGINEIMRLHLVRFTQKMDNPEVPVNTLDEDGSVKPVKVQKIYYVNIILQLRSADQQAQYRHFRVVMTRDGIIRVEDLQG